ncbi:MAG: NUDIX domain-containing protein [Acidobacteria bacterium]|nr:NUDIX domain-containing protein [Acidobacteriota bacterium]MBV9622974.1 NUDIX domain-containing protein [Acidobacteriota bacterium]
MLREISAGGVVVRPALAGWELAVIEPQKEPAKVTNDKKKAHKPVLALPKGLVHRGEKLEETAMREVQEETGITSSLVAKITDIKYMYVRSWSDNQRVFKIVSFYLLLYRSGTIDELSADMRIEVKRALWIPLDEAASRLTYRGEREVSRLAQEYLQSHRPAAP